MEIADVLFNAVMGFFLLLLLMAYGILCFLFGKNAASATIENEITGTFSDHKITRDDSAD